MEKVYVIKEPTQTLAEIYDDFNISERMETPRKNDYLARALEFVKGEVEGVRELRDLGKAGLTKVVDFGDAVSNTMGKITNSGVGLIYKTVGADTPGKKALVLSALAYAILC